MESLRETTHSVLAQLTPREAKVLRMRFGIDMNTDHTLEEVGKQFDVTRERIRQIEAKALRKLRHPSRSGAAAQLPHRRLTGKKQNGKRPRRTRPFSLRDDYRAARSNRVGTTFRLRSNPICRIARRRAAWSRDALALQRV